MSNIKIVEAPIIKPTVSKKAKEELQTLPEEQSQVVVHGYVNSSAEVRIWKTTYLYDKGSSHRSELLHVENISMYPEWTTIPAGKRLDFTLIFSGLPKSCKSFDLIEVIPQYGAFEKLGVRRNSADVYTIDFT